MGFPSSETGGATGGFAITPDDTDALQSECRAVYVGVTGNLAVKHVDGSSATYTSVAVGVFPVQVTHVLSTGTTATGLVGMV